MDMKICRLTITSGDAHTPIDRVLVPTCYPYVLHCSFRIRAYEDKLIHADDAAFDAHYALTNQFLEELPAQQSHDLYMWYCNVHAFIRMQEQRSDEFPMFKSLTLNDLIEVTGYITRMLRNLPITCDLHLANRLTQFVEKHPDYQLDPNSDFTTIHRTTSIAMMILCRLLAPVWGELQAVAFRVPVQDRLECLFSIIAPILATSPFRGVYTEIQHLIIEKLSAKNNNTTWILGMGPTINQIIYTLFLQRFVELDHSTKSIEEVVIACVNKTKI